MQQVREACRGEDVSAIKSAVSGLEQASHAFSKSIYEKTQAAAAQQTEPEMAGAAAGEYADSSDDAIDAEFEVKS